MERFNFSGDYFIEFILFIIMQYLFLLGIFFSNRKKEREVFEKEELLKLNSEKTRIALEMHDDLGADLSNFLFKLRMYQKQHPGLADDYHEIEDFSKNIIRKVNETIWTLNSEKDNLNALGNFMLKFLDEYLGPKGVTFEFKNNISGLNREVGVDYRRNIYYLFRETVKYLTSIKINVLKVEINLKHHNLEISLDFEDTLKELNHTNQNKLLDISHELAHQIKAECSFNKIDNNNYKLHYQILL